MIADHKNMAAYAIGDELYIDKLEEALREQDLYHVVTLPGGEYIVPFSRKKKQHFLDLP